MLALLLLPGVAAAQTTTEWGRLVLDGRKVGNMSLERQVDNDHVTLVTHAQATIAALDREETAVWHETEVATLDGRPLSFDYEMRMLGQTIRTSGKPIADDRWEVSVQKGDKVSVRKLRWPPNGLMAEGIDRLRKQRGLANGTTYFYRDLNPETLRFDKQFVTVVSPAETSGLIRLDLRTSPKRDSDKESVWVTPDFVTVRHTTSLADIHLDVFFCDEACARTPDQRLDTVLTTQIPASRTIAAPELGKTLRFAIVRAPSSDLRLPDTSEQRIAAASDVTRIVVEPAASATDGSGPVPADLAATRWLDIEDRKLIEFSRRVTQDAVGARARMLALQSASAKYFRSQGELLGHRRASQVIRLSRFDSGRFADSAFLLAALSRAAGIPARVVVGLTYVVAGGTPANRFVPHVWIQAWVDDRWMTFDTATGGFNTSHIAFSANVTEIEELYAAVDRMRSIETIVVEMPP